MTRSGATDVAVLRDVRMRSQRHRLVPPGQRRDPDRGAADALINAVHCDGPRAALHGMASAAMPERNHKIASQVGSESGCKAGNEAGNEAGYQAGYQAGIKAGYDVGHESGLEAAWEAGERAGREAGLEAGKQAGTQSLNGLIEAASSRQSERAQEADRLIVALKDAVVQRLQAVETDLVELVYGAVCRIIGMAAFSREGVQALMRQALSGLPARTLQAIRVSPHDHAWIEADADWKHQVLGPRVSEVQWLADERVSRGGCIVVSADGSLDARLDTQLRQFRELLLDVHANVAQGAQNTGVQNAGVQNAGVENAGAQNTGVQNAGAESARADRFTTQSDADRAQEDLS